MDKQVEYSEWVKKADEDLDSAIFLTQKHPKPLEIICYHCQQSAEKCLKAYLVLNEIRIPKTHDLIFLNKECSKVLPEFINLKQECLRLNIYGVNIRYPYNLDLEDSDVTKAISDAEIIRDFIKNIN